MPPPNVCLRLPTCNSTDLKKVSLAYPEGLFCTVAHTRFGAGVAGGNGPDLLIGKATTRGFHQTVLIQAAKDSGEVVVPKADSPVGAGVSLA